MARSYSQITTAIWRDADFRALPHAAQRTYIMLITQADISAAGVLPMTVRRWAANSSDTTQDDILRDLSELASGRFVVVDEVTEECLVRSFVRWDGGAGNPTRRTAILKAAAAVDSPSVKRALSREFSRLDLPTDGLPDGLSHGPSDDLSDDNMVVVKQVLEVPNPQPATRNHNPSAIEIADDRDDAQRICGHLADRIEGNGSKRPTITQKWLDAARLMVDKDGRTEQQVHAAIDWCQSDDFWRANILSLPKLRSQFDQMRLQAQRNQSTNPVSRRQQETDAWYERAMARAQAKEAALGEPQ